MTQSSTSTAAKIQKPSMYNVVVHKGLPFDFSVKLLVDQFDKNINEAYNLSKNIAEQEYSVVATYTREVSLTKAERAKEYSDNAGYELKIDVVKED